MKIHSLQQCSLNIQQIGQTLQIIQHLKIVNVEPLTHYPKSFERQLQQSQAIGNRPATQNMHTDAIDYRKYPRRYIENIGQRAITYNNNQPSIGNMSQLAIQNMNTENIQPSLDNRGHPAIQNMNNENVQGGIEHISPVEIENN